MREKLPLHAYMTILSCLDSQLLSNGETTKKMLSLWTASIFVKKILVTKKIKSTRCFNEFFYRQRRAVHKFFLHLNCHSVYVRTFTLQSKITIWSRLRMKTRSIKCKSRRHVPSYAMSILSPTESKEIKWPYWFRSQIRSRMALGAQGLHTQVRTAGNLNNMHTQ